MEKMMKCGHSATSNTQEGEPCCLVCYPREESMIEDPSINEELLAGREATCCYGMHKIVKSSPNLPFFSYRPKSKYDEYYCGCYGWD